MGRLAGNLAALGSAAALALGCTASALGAQSLPEFSIPAPRTAPDPRAQGPIDAENPVVRPSQPAPSTSASPSANPSANPTANPSPRPSPVPAPVPQPRPGAAVRVPAPTPAARPASDPAAAAAPRAAPLPAITEQALTPAPAIVPPAPTLLPPGDTPGAAAPMWPWLLGAGGLIAGFAVWLLQRRRRAAKPAALAFEAPVVRNPVPAPPPAPAPAPAGTPPVAQRGTVAPVMPAGEPQGLTIMLEARRMSASLMATTLSYGLTVTNNSPETLSALAIEGDMIAAHASLPPERQLASAGQQLELRHALVTLAPGESASFNGDFRLPLASLNPIRAGAAAYFVPLARLRIAASGLAGRPVVQVTTFVVGEQGEAGGGGLRPFRLDLGPRTYSRLSQRAVS